MAWGQTSKAKFDAEVEIDKDAVIDWVKNNCDPDDVFDDDILISHVRKSNSPGDVFPDSGLEEWAKDNGFVKSDE